MTWKEEIDRERGEEELIASTLTEAQALVAFDNGFGGSNGSPFTAWTATRVLFPIVYDGSEWCGSAPRNPCDEACEHQGGE